MNGKNGNAMEVGLFFLGVGSSIFLLVPRILGQVIDELNADQTKKQRNDDFTSKIAEFFKEYPLALIGVFAIGSAAICGRTYCMHTAGQLIINNLRNKVFKSILSQDMGFFDRNKVGEIVSRLSTDAFIVGHSVSLNLTEGVRALLTCIGSVALLIYTSPELCKVMTFVIPLIVGSFAVFGNLQMKYTKLMQQAVADANQVATERLSNIRTVRMLAAENREFNSYKSKMHELWLVSCREGLARGIMIGGHQLTGYIALLTVVYYGSTLISKGLLTYGELSAFALYALLCAGSIANIGSFFAELMRGLGASSRLFELQGRIPLIPLTGGIQKKGISKGISFDRVSFAYPNRSKIFQTLSFFIPAGKVTAIVGASGSGKSTISFLLLRLYDPMEGCIMVDDVPLKEIDPSFWRRQVGTVAQEPVLFSTTVRENIVYGIEDPESICDIQVEEVAAQSNSLDFINEFPDSFNTLVGEFGSTMLSGGQKQRIAIARALINKPCMLVLDEATSALDAASEYIVRIALYKLLENRKQTVLIIAHRLSTIKYADQIAVLDKGIIKECGTYDELMAIEDGVFKKLIEKQAIG